MDLEPKDNGSQHLKLGPVEKLVVWGAGVVVVAVLGFSGNWVLRSNNDAATSRKLINDKLEDLSTKQAVTNIQLANIALALQDIPSLRATSAETKIRVERLEQDVKELRSVRGLK